MIGLLQNYTHAIADLCRKYGVTRLELFGSAMEPARFDPSTSDFDFLVDFADEQDRASDRSIDQRLAGDHRLPQRARSRICRGAARQDVGYRQARVADPARRG